VKPPRRAQSAKTLSRQVIRTYREIGSDRSSAWRRDATPKGCALLTGLRWNAPASSGSALFFCPDLQPGATAGFFSFGMGARGCPDHACNGGAFFWQASIACQCGHSPQLGYLYTGQRGAPTLHSVASGVRYGKTSRHHRKPRHRRFGAGCVCVISGRDIRADHRQARQALWGGAKGKSQYPAHPEKGRHRAECPLVSQASKIKRAHTRKRLRRVKVSVASV
jgi:hypothetical protein